MNPVVPIYCDGEGKIGVGFLYRENEQWYLFTARHVIIEPPKGERYIEIDGNRINLTSPYHQSEGELYQTESETLSDVSIYEVGIPDGITPDEIVFHESPSFNSDDEFTLITRKNDPPHEIDEIDCVRYDMNQTAMIRRGNGRFEHLKNAIKLGSIGDDILPGHSGSPVFLKETNRCIGILSSGGQVQRSVTKFRSSANIIKSSHLLSQPPFEAE